MEFLTELFSFVFLVGVVTTIIFLIMALKKKTSFKKMWISLGVVIVSFLLVMIYNSQRESMYINLDKDTVTLNKKGSATIEVKTNPNAKYEVLDPDNNNKKLYGPKNTNKGYVSITAYEKGGYKLKVIKNNQSKTKEFHVKPYKQSKKEAEASYNSSSKEEASDEAAASSESVADASSEAASESADSASEASSKNPDTYNSGITYDQIARNPKDYEGKNLEFTGKVVQVIEDKKMVELRLAVDGNYDDIILVDVPNKLLDGSRVLEDDLITVGGMSGGTVSYESTLGSKITIPSMLAFGITDKGTAADAYGE